jgi:hypothetical protein
VSAWLRLYKLIICISLFFDLVRSLLLTSVDRDLPYLVYKNLLK